MKTSERPPAASASLPLRRHALGPCDPRRGAPAPAAGRRQAVRVGRAAPRDRKGERLVRFAYATDGVVRRGPLDAPRSRPRAPAGRAPEAPRRWRRCSGFEPRVATRVANACSRAASTSEARSSAPSPEPSSGSTACSGCGIRPSTFPGLVAHARDVAERAVAVLRVAQHDLAAASSSRYSASSAYQEPSPCFTGIVSSCPSWQRRVNSVSGARPEARRHGRRTRGRGSGAGRRAAARLAEDLEAVADAEHRPAGGGEVGTASIAGAKRAIAPQRR